MKSYIRLCSRFGVRRYTYGWILEETLEGYSAKKQQPVESKRYTYHATLEQACVAALDAEAGNARTAAELLAQLRASANEIVAAVKETMK